MQVIETAVDGLNRELKIVVSASDLAARLDTYLEDLKNRVQIKGFRPGKVPVAHVRKLYGKSALAEIVNTVIGETSKQAIDDRAERAASQPKIDLSDEDAEKILDGGADLAYALSYEVVPAFEVASTEGVTLERPIYEVTEADVEERLKEIAGSSLTYTPREEGAIAQDGDRLTLGYVGKVDGEAFEGGTDENAYLVLGSNRFIPGFEQQLVGVKAGDERTITVTFPADYPAPNLAGKEATFECTIKEVAAPNEIVFDDEWAKGFGIEGIEKLREMLKSQLESQFGAFTRQKIKRKLLDALDGLYSFDLPRTLVGQEFENIWRQVSAEMQQSGKSFEDEGTTEEAARADYQKIAERRVRLGLVLAKVGEQNGVQVSDTDMQQALIARARQFPGQEREVIEYFRKDPNAFAALQAPVFEEKVVDFLLGSIPVTDVPVSKEELTADEEEPGVTA